MNPNYFAISINNICYNLQFNKQYSRFDKSSSFIKVTGLLHVWSWSRSFHLHPTGQYIHVHISEFCGLQNNYENMKISYWFFGSSTFVGAFTVVMQHRRWILYGPAHLHLNGTMITHFWLFLSFHSWLQFTSIVNTCGLYNMMQSFYWITSLCTWGLMLIFVLSWYKMECGFIGCFPDCIKLSPGFWCYERVLMILLCVNSIFIMLPKFTKE